MPEQNTGQSAGGSQLPTTPLRVGSLIFHGMDQIDLTGPYEVFAKLSNAQYRLYGATTAPIRDTHGLQLQPDAQFSEAPQLDLLHVPGGPGQEALMHDEAVLGWLRQQAAGARCVFSVCTGALLLGAAGLLTGRRATTHWAAIELLPYFGATAVHERVVVDGAYVFTAGVTAGIDGALRVVANIRGADEAQTIQLWIQYAPEPPFNSGNPDTAPPHILAAARKELDPLTQARTTTARQVAERLSHQTPRSH